MFTTKDIASIIDAAKKHYRVDDKYYHTWEHVDGMLSCFSEELCPNELNQIFTISANRLNILRAICFAAIAYHDAGYLDTREHDKEGVAIKLMADDINTIEGLSKFKPFIPYISSLIDSTRFGHNFNLTAGDILIPYIHDLDYAVFGLYDPDKLIENEKKFKQEYMLFINKDKLFCDELKKFLELRLSFLEKLQKTVQDNCGLYMTRSFKQFDFQAYLNIERLISYNRVQLDSFYKEEHI